MISTEKELADLCDRLRGRTTFGIDMEFQRERTFYARLYLVQIADDDELFLVDPLAVPDLEPLYNLVCDPAIETVVHAGGQDMEIVFQQAGRPPRNIFDTQIAAALIGVGDQPGYATLIDRFFEVRLSKTETQTDWSRRPLTEAQVAYALDDVRYLAELRRRLAQRLDTLGRASWAVEEMRHYEDADTYVKDPRRLFMRVSRFRSLPRRGLAILRELAAWRESEAIRRDEPRGRIIADEVLVEIARRAPAKAADLSALRGLNPGEVRRSGDGLLAAVRAALALPEAEWPVLAPPRAEDPDVALAGDLLEVFLRSRAREAEIAPSYLGTQADLAALVEHVRGGGSVDAMADDERPALLAGWRRQLVGDDLVAIAAGRISLHVDSESGRVVATRR